MVRKGFLQGKPCSSWEEHEITFTARFTSIDAGLTAYAEEFSEGMESAVSSSPAGTNSNFFSL